MPLGRVKVPVGRVGGEPVGRVMPVGGVGMPEGGVMGPKATEALTKTATTAIVFNIVVAIS